MDCSASCSPSAQPVIYITYYPGRSFFLYFFTLLVPGNILSNAYSAFPIHTFIPFHLRLGFLLCSYYLFFLDNIMGDTKISSRCSTLE